ncbi:hypothetical protein [Xanthobacter sediminis]|uniref:hypothetical protein n=1 Tax=Xanthobacter sediminis TaxID=3119926 RepID=UPI003728F47B
MVDSVWRRPVVVWYMRNGITITLGEADRRQLDALAADRNTPQKYVWRARIVLMSADGVGTCQTALEGDPGSASKKGSDSLPMQSS